MDASLDKSGTGTQMGGKAHQATDPVSLMRRRQCPYRTTNLNLSALGGAGPRERPYD